MKYKKKPWKTRALLFNGLSMHGLQKNIDVHVACYVANDPDLCEGFH